jgi:hypothetical protein
MAPSPATVVPVTVVGVHPRAVHCAAVLAVHVFGATQSAVPEAALVPEVHAAQVPAALAVFPVRRVAAAAAPTAA